MKLGVIIIIILVIIVIVIGVMVYVMMPTNTTGAPVASAPVASAPVARVPVARVPVASAPVASAPVASAPVATTTGTAFSGPVNQETPWNELGNGTAYMDRHNIDCGEKALSGIHLVHDNKGNFHYEYKCTSGGDLQVPVDKSTQLDDYGGGSTYYLDRHNIDCETGSVLTQMMLKAADNKLNYVYKCAPTKKNLTCRDVSTTFNDDGGGDMRYLDRHDIQCNANEALSKVQYSRGVDGKTIQYKYKCCT